MENVVIKQLLERKSVRAYEDRPIEEEKVQTILQATLQAPTAGNMMLYSILHITDQALKDKLAITCDNQPFIATAPLVLVFLADYHRWYAYFQELTDEKEDLRSLGMGDMLLACADALVAAQTAVVAADALGLGSCYIGDIIENFEIHQEILNLPAHVVPVGMVCFGYPTKGQQTRPQPTRFAKEKIIFENTYHEMEIEELQSMMPPEKAKALMQRKFTSDFSEEMNRSAEKIVENFLKTI